MPTAVHDAVEESPDGASVRAAAAAAHGVLTHYFPDRTALVDARYAACPPQAPGSGAPFRRARRQRRPGSARSSRSCSARRRNSGPTDPRP